MKKENLKIILATILAAIIIAATFSFIQYPENEGFNPTDEGVVLAQSWRILNGEIPHKDFISIRPAASGYFHLLALILPGNAVINARWIVIFQFFAIAFISAFIIYSLLSKKYGKSSLIIYILMLATIFTVGISNYNLYSWTTIDAVFFGPFWQCHFYSTKKASVLILPDCFFYL